MTKAKLAKITTYSLLYLITAFLIGSLFFWTPIEQNNFPIFRTFIIFFSTILLTKYFIYMTISPWYNPYMKWKIEHNRRRMKYAYKPLVSVIIPAWNEEVGLVTTVKSVLKSKYRNMEIVVVNDGSTDSSDERMRNFLAEYEKEIAGETDPIRVIYEYKENGGKGKALNHGISLSSGEIIMSIDADCALTPATIGNFVKCFEDENVVAAVGNVKIGNRKHILGTLQYLEFLFSFYFKKADSLLGTIYIIGGAGGAFRRNVFGKIGMYSDQNITEDIDLSVRIQAAGMKIVYAANAVIFTEGASNIQGLSAQRLRWKRGRFQTFYEHRKLFFSVAPRHNKLLTWVVLPMALFGDTQLFFEVIFLFFLYIYALLTHDASSFISGIIVVSSMFFVQIFDDAKHRKSSLHFIAPIGWLLFYITTLVEYSALIKSLQGLITRKDISWQKWNRKGVTDKELHPINETIV